MANAQPTLRTTVKRVKERAGYDYDSIYAILDQAYYGTIAFQDAHGIHAIPTAIWRHENYLYIHGSNGSRMLKQLQTGLQTCVSVTHIDGLVLARSAFHHSMNYRSVCIYGVFETVDTDKATTLIDFMDSILPGRQMHVREGDRNELAATTVLRIHLDEVVLKARTGGVKDDEADLQQAVWAGVIPIHTVFGEPEQDSLQNHADLPGLNLDAFKK